MVAAPTSRYLIYTPLYLSTSTAPFLFFEASLPLLSPLTEGRHDGRTHFPVLVLGNPGVERYLVFIVFFILGLKSKKIKNIAALFANSHHVLVSNPPTSMCLFLSLSNLI